MSTEPVSMGEDQFALKQMQKSLWEQKMRTPARILGTALLLGTFASVLVAQTSEEKKTPESVLFVQHAEKATLADNTLTLEGADKNVIVFADRPHRAAATIPVVELVKTWGEGADSFASDPPNAALVGETDDGEPVSLIVEIRNPVLSENSISYQYSIIEGDDQGAINNPYVVIDMSYLDQNIASTFATVSQAVGIPTPSSGLNWTTTD
ncbi:hypothetical protein SAMN05444358_1011739 [Ruegeria halocynthiae]|uniref:Uncharacterized protein n=1 Tax=Ruegeria halocynthiae TaxID=985054 RepID=A0A1H2WBS7_9RHOB|nr:hypothetical protein [Ruegeria halocynthiae]SDW78072.1 hypothetical protein SAMN05444358_1011739 [Ruegeria halocynthiae]